MKYFIIGATGFVGGHLTRLLLEQGHQVTATYRRQTTTRIPMSTTPDWHCRSLDQISAQDLLGHDVLVFLAAAGMPNNPEKVSFDEMFYYNVDCLIKILRAAKDAGVGKIIIGSTFKEYGWSCDRYDYVPTTAPLNPTTAFACSRVAGYYAARAFAFAENVNIEYIRFFNLYGEGENAPDLWTALRNAAITGQDFAMTNGEQIRDYLDITIAINQLAVISQQPNRPGLHISHIASGQPVKLRDFADYWWRQWSATGKINYGQLPYRSYESMRIVAKL